jgi:flagellar hook-associated protein 2
MRTIAGSSYDVEGTFKTLSSIGLGTESADYGKSGKLEFDEATFMEAMLEDPESVTELMNAFAADLQDFTDSMVSDSTVSVGGTTAKEGKITNRIDYLETQSDEIDERIESWEAQLEMEQATLEARYTAMEVALAELEQSSSYLSALSSMDFSNSSDD